MAIVRSYANGFELTDWTPEIVNIPNQWGYVGQLNLFNEVGVTQHTISFDEITKDGAVLLDTARGARGVMNKDYTRKTHSLSIPHFNVLDAILPADIQGKRAYGGEDAETLAAVRMRKMERIRQNFAWTLEKARVQVLSNGTVYSPNGTVSINYFTEFGVTQKVVDCVLGTSGTTVSEKISEGTAHILTNSSGSNVSGFICLCSPEFFAKLIKHETVKQAFLYYSTTGGNNPLRDRVGGNTTLYRTFFWQGVTFVEYMGAYGGTQMIAANDAILIPDSSDSFETVYSPANRLDLVNSMGESLYLFESPELDGSAINIFAESNFANILKRPAQVVRLHTSN